MNLRISSGGVGFTGTALKEVSSPPPQMTKNSFSIQPPVILLLLGENNATGCLR